jgi:hypothetical protein
MHRRILLGMTFTLAFAVVQASAFAQAAAEAGLLNAGSSTATVKAGTRLNSAMNQGSKQLAGRVQGQVSQPAPGRMSQVGTRPVSTSPAKSTAASEGAAQAQGAVIASIQGAESSCAPGSRTASTPESKTAAESAQTTCSGPDPASKPAPQKNKSVITLSFSK